MQSIASESSETVHPSERRRDVRVFFPALAALERGKDQNDSLLVTVANLSRRGIGVEVTTQLIVGDTIRVRLGLGDSIQVLQARVVISRKKDQHSYYSGLAWTETHPQALASLEGYLRRRETLNLARRLSNWNLSPRGDHQVAETRARADRQSLSTLGALGCMLQRVVEPLRRRLGGNQRHASAEVPPRSRS